MFLSAASANPTKLYELIIAANANVRIDATTPFELITKSKDYTIKDIAQNIKCPTLVLDAEKDDSFPGQPKKDFEALSCPKKYILFTAEEGAEEHCQCGAAALSNQRIFDWLDETLNNKI